MRLTKKVSAAALSSVLLLNTIVPAPCAMAANDTKTPLKYAECEDLDITSDLKVTTSIWGEPKPGYTGDGFVWMQGGGTISLEVTVPEDGMYSVTTRYMQELSEEGRLQYLYVNGKSTGSYMLPYATEWKDFSFGLQRLHAGTNTIQIKSGWGYAYFDSVTVDYGNMPALTVEPILSDSQATAETQALMNYLTSVYGNNILSGQQEIYGNGHDGNYEYEFDWLYDLTGKYPAIRGFDFMNYNPMYWWDDGTTDRVIDWVNNKNGIATACWHINVPKKFSDYTLGEDVDWKDVTYKPNETDFDTKKAVIPGTKEYEYVQLIIEDLAEQLQILQENNVPVIWRPFHEAEGNGGALGEGAWFWWAKSGAEVYKQLWKMLYTELTETYGLHNLIWNYNSYTYSTAPQWYPGDEYVDLIGFDKYNTVYNRYDGLTGVPNEDAISSTFYQLVDMFDGKKMVCMAENDTIPSLKNLTIEKAGWLYFCPWYGEYLMDEKNNYKDTLIELYQSDYVLTLDELPDWKNLGQIPTKTPVVTTPVVTSEVPVTTTPVVTSEVPVTTVPVVTSEVPVTTTPVVTCEVPVTTVPVVTSEAPVTTAPVVTSEAPVTTAPVTIVPPTTSSPTSGAKPVVTVTTNEGGSINQQYNITSEGTDAVDFSKLVIRYYYDKSSNKAQTFWCDNAGLQLNVSPWYVNIASDVVATFHDGYVEIAFDSSYKLAPGTGKLSMGVRFAQSDWSSYSDFADKGVVVYYDGEIVTE